MTSPGNAIVSHLRDDGTPYQTVDAWTDDTYLSIELEEAIKIVRELVLGIAKLERMVENDSQNL